MNAIQLLSAQPWAERLGWTLVHFLWQGVLIAAAYAAVRRWIFRSAGPAAGPDGRYGLACAALAGMAAAPFLTFSMLGPATASPVAVSVHLVATASAPAAPRALRLDTEVPRPLPRAVLPWVVALWLTGAAAFWLRFLGGWLGTLRLRSRFVHPAPQEWQQTLHRLKVRIRVSRPVRLLVSSLVQAPAVVGWLRPLVLVPIGALAGLPPEQMEALLLHELAHIRRHDYLVNLIQSAIEALLFYHPAVWWVSSHIRTERELCCDDVAVSISGDVLSYVRALAELESARPVHTAALAATGGSLSRRIARLLGESRPAPGNLSGPGVFAATMLLAVAVFGVFGQPAARPKFEVASIKPSVDQGFRMLRPLPSRLEANAPLRMILQNAYSVQPFQLVGGPAWIDSDRYAIDAKPAVETGRAGMMLMLQSLLEERFQLKIHRETRELPVYALVPARGGAKLSNTQKGTCVSPGPDASPIAAGGRIPPPDPGQAPPPPCGAIRVMLAQSGARMEGGSVMAAELTRTLSMVLERTVIDKTGFAGAFDVRLVFQPDETTAALPAPPLGAADSNTPAIGTALQEQLGLRLESTKGPVEVIVIDSIERPSAN